jgi:DHA2 family multidrug resistance protein
MGGNNFEKIELLLSCGFACSFIGLLASIVLEGLELGALTNATAAATYSGFMHFLRLFGGQVGASFMGHLISAREKFHSNLLGLHVQLGNWSTDERLADAAGRLRSWPEEAQKIAQREFFQAGAKARVLGGDGFDLLRWMVVAHDADALSPTS